MKTWGAEWWVSQVYAGCAGAPAARHGDPSGWIWAATRTSLELALQGYIVKVAPRRSA